MLQYILGLFCDLVILDILLLEKCIYKICKCKNQKKMEHQN